MSNYQVDVLAEAMVYAQGGSKVQDIDKEEATDIVKYLNQYGWRITREDTADVIASDGPIQRALGMNGRDGGDGF